MAIKILLLFLTLVSLVVVGRWLLRKPINNYNIFTWSAVELFWYMISFAAVCIGLYEIDRIERLDNFNQREKQLALAYQDTKNLLYSQTRLISMTNGDDANEEQGAAWFIKMLALLDEGLYSKRWESFLRFSRSFIFKEPGFYADPKTNAFEFNWPADLNANPEKIYLREEIRYMVDNLKQLQAEKENVGQLRPKENTNYVIRYVLVFLYLVGLSLKILKIHADYKKARVILR